MTQKTYRSNLERLVEEGLYAPKATTYKSDVSIAEETPYEVLSLALKAFKEKGVSPISLSWVQRNMVNLDAYKTAMSLERESDSIAERNSSKRTKGKTKPGTIAPKSMFE